MIVTVLEADYTAGDSARRRGPADMVRLTILAPHTQIDLALPSTVPVELLVPSIADLVQKHSSANDFDASEERTEPARWTLSRLGTPPLAPALSLQEHGVLDGELLVFDSAEASAPPPLFDDIMYNVAIADKGHTRPWTPQMARLTGSALAIAAAAAGSFALLQVDGSVASLVGAGCALLTLVLFLVAGAVGSRVYGDTAAAVTLGAAALPVAFASGVLLVPGERDAPHVLLGLVMVGATAVLALRASGVGHTVFTTATAVSLFGATAALAATLTEQSVRTVGALLAAAALIGLASAPRIAMLLARLPLPPVPAPGTSVDPAEDDPDDARSVPSFESVEARTDRARRFLTGLVCAMTLLTGFGVLAASVPVTDSGIYWPGTALAVAAATVLLFRGRTYSSAEQAVPLIGGGGTILVLLCAATALAVPVAALGLFAVAALAVGAALALGILAPERTFSPVQRRASELVDYAAIAAVVPLVCWVSGIFAAVRGL
ncbi:type VII secretion integral membrane protein EccD [Rhodococcus xishaensis]|uniref:Type VII secretion integral membrane protein EccD n=1 Tax=Rhodococcus xishaensis TaxID=2487364 RepID=A0A438B4B4_9NOCA|nr:type VII secretion integral membrane protein EccD [Rhodococcus xishaensis]RVW05779.1 type VII secretion integral membrane protein EccD [Rhodococcus xishaensis]